MTTTQGRRQADSAMGEVPVTLPALVGSLQQLPVELRWAVADEALLRSVARRQPLQRGRSGQLLYRLLTVAARLGVEWALLTLVGFFGLWILRLRPASPHTHPDGTAVEHVFVGFGAGAEDTLWQRFKTQAGGRAVRVNQVEPATFTEVLSPGWWAQWHALRHALVLARAALQRLPAALQPYRLDVLRFIGIRLGHYAFYRAWFAAFKRTRATPQSLIAFLTPDTAAYAACMEGLSCHFMQHGLLFHLLLPDFAVVSALTDDEAQWFSNTLPQARVLPPTVPLPLDVDALNDKIAIASIYGSDDFLARIRPFVEWAGTQHRPLVVRPHPREDHDFWRQSGLGQRLEFDKVREPFVAMLQRRRPKLVVSWYSTTLAEALQLGIIPVTVCAPDDASVAEMVYPLFRRALLWPRDRDTIERVLVDADAYRSVLARLRAPLAEAA